MIAWDSFSRVFPWREDQREAGKNRSGKRGINSHMTFTVRAAGSNLAQFTCDLSCFGHYYGLCTWVSPGFRHSCQQKLSSLFGGNLASVFTFFSVHINKSQIKIWELIFTSRAKSEAHTLHLFFFTFLVWIVFAERREDWAIVNCARGSHYTRLWRGNSSGGAGRSTSFSSLSSCLFRRT